MAFLDEEKARVLLLDIEGTTTPIDFVYKTLFPFASRRLEPFLREHSRDVEIRSLLQDLQTQNELDRAQGLHPPAWRSDSEEALLTSSIAYAQWLIDKDSKYTALKSLQGKIWQEGFAKGELRGQVYPDVPPAFERWRRQGRKICIYSSGSVLAQKLLFSTVASCDLTRLVEAHFDTSVGAKGDPQSYLRIAEALALPAREILFISDVARELDAAREAGMQTALCVRGELPADAASGKYFVVGSFDVISPWRHRKERMR